MTNCDFPVHKLLNNRLGFPGFLQFFPPVSANKSPMPSCIQTIWMISGSRNIPRSVELDRPCAHGSPIWKQWFSIAMLNYNKKTYLYIYIWWSFICLRDVISTAVRNKQSKKNEGYRWVHCAPNICAGPKTFEWGEKGFRGNKKPVASLSRH